MKRNCVDQDALGRPQARTTIIARFHPCVVQGARRCLFRTREDRQIDIDLKSVTQNVVNAQSEQRWYSAYHYARDCRLRDFVGTRLLNDLSSGGK